MKMENTHYVGIWQLCLKQLSGHFALSFLKAGFLTDFLPVVDVCSGEIKKSDCLACRKL